MIQNCLFIFLALPLLVLTTVNATALEDSLTVFRYQFPDINPVKIYSGAVTFAHKRHIFEYKINCVRCHHSVEPGDLYIKKSCRQCHVKEGFPRFEEAVQLSHDEKNKYYLIALHSQCIDCHIATKLKVRQSRPPISCTGCHLPDIQ
jgi:class III cytochrome C family protein